MYSYGSPHMAAQKQDDQLERTFNSYVRIQDVVPKTYLGRWTIGRSGERGSGISVLPARYDDDDDIYIIMNRGIDILSYKLPWQENPAHTYTWHTEHWTAVSTLFGLISSAHRDLHYWRLTQQLQYAEAETLPLGHWFMPRIRDTELTSYGKLHDHLT